MTHMGIALFDFDKTIVRGDSIVPFILYSVSKGKAKPSALFHAVWSYIRYGFKRIDARSAKEEAMSFLKGMDKKSADALADGFYEDVLKKRIFPDAAREIEKCRREGLMVLLVSASPDVYMDAVKKGLDAHDVIATRCALDENNVYLGKLGSQNCKGFEKTLRIAEFLASSGVEPDMAISRSYGDSLSDFPMLHLTRKPTLVNGKRKTIKEAHDMARVTWK